MRTYYFKRQQAGELWQYYKLLLDRDPPGLETVNFQFRCPTVSFNECDQELGGSEGEVLYGTLCTIGQRIEAFEYEEAYKSATTSSFSLYINNRPVEWLADW